LYKKLHIWYKTWAQRIITILSLLLFTACSTQNKKDNNDSLKMKAEENASRQSVPKLRYEVFQNTLGEATTKILDRSTNRMKNIDIAIKSISGITIEKGAEFSFNNIVGKRSANRGFEEAPVIAEGKSERGIGGGVCQVSSTLYMAAKNAGLWIKERHSHTKPVPYAKKNNDATVVYGVKDFKFANTSEYSITIYMWVESDILYAKIVTNEEKAVYE